MGEKFTAITVRMDCKILDAIDREMERLQQQNELYTLTRSEFIRFAIWQTIGIAEKNRKKARLRPRTCAFCCERLTQAKTANSWTNLEGKKEFSCFTCAQERLREIGPPK